VIFVGDESHGKTSTLARILHRLILPSSGGKFHTSSTAGLLHRNRALDIFHHDPIVRSTIGAAAPWALFCTGMTTRCPIRLRLRHDPTLSTQRIYLQPLRKGGKARCDILLLYELYKILMKFFARPMGLH
jgi:hypothetical protein